jgi:hypothetical protein
MINFNKKIFLAISISVISSISINTYTMLQPVRFPDGQEGIAFKPDFKFTLNCFLDKISAFGTLATISAGIGLYFLKNGISAYIEQDNTYDKNNTKISRETMQDKAKKYGIAAAVLLTPSFLIISKNLFYALSRSSSSR